MQISFLINNPDNTRSWIAISSDIPNTGHTEYPLEQIVGGHIKEKTDP